jgi:hypothetical protein
LPSIQVGKNGSLGVGPVGLAVSVDVHLYGGVGCVSDKKKVGFPCMRRAGKLGVACSYHV